LVVPSLDGENVIVGGMVEVPPVTPEALSWILAWLEAPLSGESLVCNSDEVARLHRDLVDRAAQDPSIGPESAAAAASVAVQLFELLLERDPQAAGEYLGDLRQKLAAL
jgi:hypothetical protein